MKLSKDEFDWAYDVLVGARTKIAEVVTTRLAYNDVFPESTPLDVETFRLLLAELDRNLQALINLELESIDPCRAKQLLNQLREEHGL